MEATAPCEIRDVLFLVCEKHLNLYPIPSKYGIFTYIYHTNQPNVGKYTIHGFYGYWLLTVYQHHGYGKKTPFCIAFFDTYIPAVGPIRLQGRASLPTNLKHQK